MLHGVVDIPLAGQLANGDENPGKQAVEAVASLPFLAGPENELVLVVVRSILEPATNGYNPIVLYGPSGTGKTHLARGLYWIWKDAYPRRQALYVSAVDFARQLADAIETQTVDDFTGRYRQSALVVMDDLHLLVGKTAAQEELRYTIDALLAAGGRLVMTSRHGPAGLPGLLPGLASRLIEGLVVPILPPGVDARLALIQRFAQLRSIALPDDSVERLAEGLPGTAAELSGAINRLQLLSQIHGQTIDADTVREFLSEQDHSSGVSIHDIALASAKWFSVKLRDLRGPRKPRAVVTARAMAMYLARNLTSRTLREIGQYFGGRDHTTVSHGSRKMEEMLKNDPTMRDTALQLLEILSRKKKR